MAVDEMQVKGLLNKLKKDFALTAESTKGINLGHFPSFNKGDNFKIIYAWKFPHPLQSIYLVKYRNSYNINIVAPQLGAHSPHTKTFNCLGLYTRLDHTIPDFTIRPNTLADKFVNLFLRHSIKVKEFQEFNHKYLLESPNSSTIEQVIGGDFFNLMFDTNDLNVEVRDNRCWIFCLKPLDYHYCRVAIQLSEEIVKRSIINNMDSY
jgi:hypothetical protein